MVAFTPGVKPLEGEFASYDVKSQSRPKDFHRVDLMAYRGNGSCVCEHFMNRCAPKLEEMANPAPELRCKHIEMARSYFVETLFQRIEAESRAAATKQKQCVKPKSAPTNPGKSPGRFAKAFRGSK